MFLLLLLFFINYFFIIKTYILGIAKTRVDKLGDLYTIGFVLNYPIQWYINFSLFFYMKKKFVFYQKLIIFGK